MRKCLIFAAAGLTVAFVTLPLSFSYSPYSSLPQLTVDKAEAWVTYRRARVATRRTARRVYRYNYYHGARPYYGARRAVVVAAPAAGYSYSYGAGYGSPEYGYSSAGNYYNGSAAYARPGWGWGRGWGAWHRPHWGSVRGWHWWR